jgi:hypothetical protein
VFGEAGDGVVGYTPTADLEAVGLTARDAERIALENLCRRVQQGDVSGRTMLGDGGQPAFILWGAGHWLSASSLILPGLRALAQHALGCTEICAAIPHRDIMFLFGAQDQAWRTRMQALITEKESGCSMWALRLITSSHHSRTSTNRSPTDKGAGRSGQRRSAAGHHEEPRADPSFGVAAERSASIA